MVGAASSGDRGRADLSGTGPDASGLRQLMGFDHLLPKRRYRRLAHSDRRVGVFHLSATRRLVVTWCPRRVRKDARDCERTVRKRQKKWQKSRTPNTLRSRHPQRRFLRIEGESRVTLDPERVAAARICAHLALSLFSKAAAAASMMPSPPGPVPRPCTE